MSKKRQAWMKKADVLFSKLVRARDGGCLAAGFDGRDCKGVLQCCHLIGRGELSIRVDLDNAASMCQSHHVFYTHNPGQWLDFIERRWPGRLEVLRGRIREHVGGLGKVDWKFEYERLKKELEALDEPA